MRSALSSPNTLARLERLVELARRAPPPRARARPRPSRGIEPGGRRDYTPGDDLRMLDWAAYARLERLLVKVTESLPEAHVDLLLDTSGSMGVGSPTPHERAGLALAGIAACALGQGARVTVWWCEGETAHLELRRAGELIGLVRSLAELHPQGTGTLTALASRISTTRRPRGAAVLLSDALDTEDTAQAARCLRSSGHSPLVVVVSPSFELERGAARAALDGGRVELLDAETGERRVVPFAAASLVQAAQRRNQRQLHLAELLGSIPFEVLLPEAEFEEIALGMLRRG